jgi:hypothetical protein
MEIEVETFGNGNNDKRFHVWIKRTKDHCFNLRINGRIHGVAHKIKGPILFMWIKTNSSQDKRNGSWIHGTKGITSHKRPMKRTKIENILNILNCGQFISWMSSSSTFFKVN